MKLSKTALVCAAAIAAFALAAQAQTPSSGGATQSPSHADTQKMMGDKAKADTDYKAAQEACNVKTGTEKTECLKEAKAAHERALGKKESSMAHSPGMMGSTPGTGGAAQPPSGSSQGSSTGTGYSSSTTSTGTGKK